jgi:hypothetical protein
MTQDELIDMAKTAGFMQHLGVICIPNILCLERFAELVIKPWADQLEVERKRFQELNDVVATGMQHARAAERRACAQLCERMWHEWLDSTEDSDKPDAEDCYRAIRARGQT